MIALLIAGQRIAGIPHICAKRHEHIAAEFLLNGCPRTHDGISELLGRSQPQEFNLPRGENDAWKGAAELEAPMRRQSIAARGTATTNNVSDRAIGCAKRTRVTC